MSKVVRFPEPEKIEEAACDWIARLDAGELSESETQALQHWLRQDRRHEIALLEMASLLDQMTVVSSLNKLLPLTEVAMDIDDQQPVTSKFTVAALGLAASLIVSVAVVLTLDWNRDDSLIASYQTAIGEVKDVEIGDGSTVTLNTASTIDVRLSDRERRVILSQGEAMFHVQHEKERPFIVEANGHEIKAVGTAFNVSWGLEQVEITVTEGVVEVLPAVAVEHFRNTEGQQRSQVNPRKRLVVGESMTITEADIVTESVEPEEVDAKLSWQNGELVFRGESLEHVVAEVSRYSHVALTISDDSIREIPVGGVFKIGEIENLIDTLEHGFGITAERRAEDNIYLRGDSNSRE